MLDFLIELDSEDLKLGVDGFSQGDLTIKGEQSSISSSGNTMMIFISLTNFLCGIQNLANNNIKKYKFEAIEGGFTFYVTQKNNTLILTDHNEKVILKSTMSKFTQSLWKGINEFYNNYKYLITKADSGIDDFENAIEEFKTQFSEYFE